MRPTTMLFLLPALPLSGLLACAQEAPEIEEIAYPKLVLSDANLEFGDVNPGDSTQRSFTISNTGEMPMGIGSIELVNGQPENFSVTWDVAQQECAEPVDSGAGPGEGKTVDSSTGGDDSNITPTNDTAVTDDSGGGTAADAALFVIPAGCKQPVTVTFTPVDVGDVYGGLVIEAIQKPLTKQQEDDNELPDYLRDPYRWRQQLYLHGESAKELGIVVVRPRTVDFGNLNVGDTSGNTRQIGIANVGGGDIVLNGSELMSTCDVAYEITFSPPVGRVLHAGETALIEVKYTPEDTDPAYCDLHVYSDDVNNPDIDVRIKGNSGTDPENRPPTVAVRSPEPGSRFNGIGTLRVELNVFDVNQPADSLICKIKSAVVQQVSVASCTPSDASGHVFVDIDAELLKPGIDTLLVTVTDAEETTAYASTSIVISSEFPEGDDDGDGFDENTDPPDCDDSNRATYPYAAEVADGLDNNCNILVDEDTSGYDDDGDAFSEDDGDCNDYNRQAYPRAPERGDGVDNDCDGLVDESTSLYDDDGDGYAEVNNDCDDDNSNISPAAVELCDGFDNDCDGLKDAADGCASTNSVPLVVGQVKPSQNACLSGERITLDVKVEDADEQTLSYTWSDDAGNGTANFDNPAAQTVNWTCPEVGDGGRKFNVYVVAYDPDNNQVWTFEEISVYPDDFTDLYLPYEKITYTRSTGCSTAAGSGSGLLLLGGMAGMMMRRRRS